MADLRDIEQTYDYMDELFRDSFGEHGDITCAWYDGDFSKTLEDAQRDKHELVLRELGVREGSRILDVGCGWGPVLHAARQRSARAIGITLSPKQAEACRRNGLDVHLLDWNDLDRERFGTFDGLVSIGAMEHFCSPEQHQKGQQENVYRRFFRTCHDLLEKCGRMYLQTMTWSRNSVPIERMRLDAPPGSDEHVCALVREFYPGSWVPESVDQVRRCAEPWFREVWRNDGRLDYIETMSRWQIRWTPKRAFLALKLVWPWLTRREFRYRIKSLRRDSNRELFVREILTLARVVYERV